MPAVKILDKIFKGLFTDIDKEDKKKICLQ